MASRHYNYNLVMVSLDGPSSTTGNAESYIAGVPVVRTGLIHRFRNTGSTLYCVGVTLMNYQRSALVTAVGLLAASFSTSASAVHIVWDSPGEIAEEAPLTFHTTDGVIGEEFHNH